MLISSYLYIGVKYPSLYHMTRIILSSASGGITLHGNRPIFPRTASAKCKGTENKIKNYKKIIYNNQITCDKTIQYYIHYMLLCVLVNSMIENLHNFCLKSPQFIFFSTRINLLYTNIIIVVAIFYAIRHYITSLILLIIVQSISNVYIVC